MYNNIAIYKLKLCDMSPTILMYIIIQPNSQFRMKIPNITLTRIPETKEAMNYLDLESEQKILNINVVFSKTYFSKMFYACTHIHIYIY